MLRWHAPRITHGEIWNRNKIYRLLTIFAPNRIIRVLTATQTRERAMIKLSSAEICRPAAVLPVALIISGPSYFMTGAVVHSIHVI